MSEVSQQGQGKIRPAAFYHQGVWINPSRVCSYIDLVGEEVAPRGRTTKEIIGLCYDGPLTQWLTRLAFNSALAKVEGENLVRGVTDLVKLRAVAPKTTKRFYEANWMSWYAESMREYQEDILEQLQEDRQSRKAVAYIGAQHSLDEDKTCATTVQALIRDERLSVVVNMRSNDMWLGFPYNLAMFSIWGQAVASVCEAEPGRIIFQTGSAHIYTPLSPMKPREWKSEEHVHWLFGPAWKWVDTGDYVQRWESLKDFLK